MMGVHCKEVSMRTGHFVFWKQHENIRKKHERTLHFKMNVKISLEELFTMDYRLKELEN